MSLTSNRWGADAPRTFVGDALWASVSAYILALAHLHPRYAALAWIGLMPLIRIVRLNGPPRVGILGAIWGVVFFGLYALTHPSFELGYAIRLTVVGASGLGIATAVYGLISRRFGFNPVLFGMVWILFEWGRAAAGFSGGILASSVPNPSAFGQVVSAFGLLTVSLLIVLVNAVVDALLDWVCAETHGSPGPRLVPIAIYRYCRTSHDYTTPSYSIPYRRGPPLHS